MTPLLLTLLAAAPVQARFVLEVAGLPVAELRVSLKGTKYVYEATHFLEEGPRQRRVELTLSAKEPTPEVLALLTKPVEGCRDVLEERSGKREVLCVEALWGQEARGTIDGVPFTAGYDAHDRLERIDVGSARWLAARAPVKPPPESPFVRGVAAPAGAKRLVPDVPGARWLGAAPKGIGDPSRVGRARCLVLAREAATERPGSRVSVGLVLEGDRAFPHAWLTQGEEALDPSVVEDDPVLARRRYVEVPPELSGRFYLELFDGAVRLER